MSLLMDALRRAEEANVQAHLSAPGQLDTWGLAAPARHSHTSTNPHSHQTQEMVAVNAEAPPIKAELAITYRTHSPFFHSAPPPQVAPINTEPPLSAPSVAQTEPACTAPTGEANHGHPSRPRWMSLAMVCTLGLTGIACWVWLEGQTQSQVEPLPAPFPKGFTDTPAPTRTTPIANHPPGATTPHAPTSQVYPTPVVPLSPRNGINESKPTVDITKPSVTLLLAYEALERGELSTADRAYEAVLATDGQNLDALLGLALIQLRRGQVETAATLIHRVLILDPLHPNGLALWASIKASEGNTPQQRQHEQSRLQQALQENPNAAALHFALGNLYAQQYRWSEAQAAYFKAVSGDDRHPDYLLNLAISLDHLGQTTPARQYYAAALEAGTTRPGSFDVPAIAHRLQALGGQP